MTADHIVEIRDLAFSYAGTSLLQDIHMDLPRGKVVAIMGRSGCGKTTLLKLIGGQLRPGRGSVRLDGQAVHELDRRGLYRLRGRMGMLFQFGALFTDLSVFDNVAFPLRERTDLPETVIRDLVLMKLEAVGLRGAASLMPGELSGGMARRVSLARAIALDPDLMMYDEPFTGLDPISLAITGSLIRRLTDSLGITSVVVTHDVVESFRIVDYVYFIADGRIAAQGTPEDLRASPDPFVRQFVNAEETGPVPFHVPAPPYGRDLALED